MTTADEFKSQGNSHLQSGKISQAIECYTQAIALDGSNHVYYSNRSAAYLKQGDAQNALDDALSCLGLKPDFSKGYSRKGAALHALKRYNDAVAAYEDGLSKFPNDAALQRGLEEVKRDKDGGAGSAPSLFSPQMMAQMALDPRLRGYLNDPEVMAKIKLLQQNPNLLPTVVNDPKMMELLGVMMGGEGGIGGDEAAAAAAPSPPPAPAAPPKKEPEPMEEEEDWSHLTEEERAVKEKQKQAVELKKQGNDLYKAKEFEKALAKYDEAIAMDETNMTFWSNKAAVYFTQNDFEKCTEACFKAVEIGKRHQAPFEDRAKAYVRCAKAFQKMKNLEKAIEQCKEAQLEYYDKTTQRLLKTLELEKKKQDAMSYQDDEKAEEAKQRGNDFFRNQQWGEAVEQYEEAVKRAPKNAPIRNNLAAALCKIMDFAGAKRQIQEALDLDPKYVKAWARKGDIEIYMKEYHKAMDSYKQGLALDSENKACQEGLRKVTALISYGRSSMTDEQKREQAAHAMADPEIQAILQDPVMQQILKDFAENPQAAQQAMQDATIRAKLEKLIAAGVIETR